MTTRHERRATHSRRLEAAAVGTAALLTFLLCQLAPDEEPVGTEGMVRDASVPVGSGGAHLRGTSPAGPDAEAPAATTTAAAARTEAIAYESPASVTSVNRPAPPGR